MIVHLGFSDLHSFEACQDCILFLSLRVCASSPFPSYRARLWLLTSPISYSRYPLVLYGGRCLCC